MISTNVPLTNTTDGRQRLAGVMTSPFAGTGGSLGNVGGGMQTNNVTSPYSGATSGLPTGGSLGTVDPTGGSVDPTGGGHLDGTTGMDYGSAGTGTGSSANQPVDSSASAPAPANIGSQADYEAYNHLQPSSQNTLGSYNMQIDPNAAKTAADAAYGAASEYFQPDFTRQQSDLENQLAAQGFTRGSEGYTRALDDMQRQQDLARTNAALSAQGVGFGQANQLIQDALTMRGQDRGVDSASVSASGNVGAAQVNANGANYRADLDSELGLRGLGLQQDNQNFNQTMALMGGARGGVNSPNFGPAAPLDVGGAYGIASGNQNSALNRAASDRNGLYQLGGSLLGGYLNGG